MVVVIVVVAVVAVVVVVVVRNGKLYKIMKHTGSGF